MFRVRDRDTPKSNRIRAVFHEFDIKSQRHFKNQSPVSDQRHCKSSHSHCVVEEVQAAWRELFVRLHCVASYLGLNESERIEAKTYQTMVSLKMIKNRRRSRSLIGLAACLLFQLRFCLAEGSIRKSDDIHPPPVVTPNVDLDGSTQEYQEEVVVTHESSPPPVTTPSVDPEGSLEPQQRPDVHEPPPPIEPPATSPTHSTPVRSQIQVEQQDFLDWCASVGIRTNLTIQIFEYSDYMTYHSDMMADDDDYAGPPESYPTIQVRGLAAVHDIEVGEVVISIPYSSMIAVPTTIDNDPILNKVMGPQARKKYEWENDEFYELSLLTVALLYHRKLGKASPLSHYISILESSPTDSIPFLWNKAKLRQSAPEGVRRYARGIYRDIQEAYTMVLQVLRRDFPDVFDTETYSLSNYLWAFALINSRHWHLPIPDFHKKQQKQQESENHAPQAGIGDQVPPASLPTDEWVIEHQGDTDEDDLPPENNSFLAPVADLLNFGPPCTQGSYNAKTRAFELVATCSFQTGQEVTYWYSDDCDDVVIANYGFTHPMVPSCPSAVELQQDIDFWKRRALNLETEIGHAYDDIDELEREMERAVSLLTSCNCDGFKRPRAASKSRKGSGDTTHDDAHDHIRGSGERRPTDHERNGIRRKGWNHQKSTIGEQL